MRELIITVLVVLAANLVSASGVEWTGTEEFFVPGMEHQTTTATLTLTSKLPDGSTRTVTGVFTIEASDLASTDTSRLSVGEQVMLANGASPTLIQAAHNQTVQRDAFVEMIAEIERIARRAANKLSRESWKPED